MSVVAITLLLASMLVAGTYLFVSIRFRFSLSFLLFGSLLLIHGVALIVYLTVTGKDSTIYGLALSSVNEDSTLLRLICAISLMFLLVSAGSHFAVLAARSMGMAMPRSGGADRKVAAPQVYELGFNSLFLLVVLAIGMLLVSALQGHVRTVIEYFSVDLSAIERNVLRLESGGTPYYLYNLALSSIAPFLCFVLYSYWRTRSRRTLAWIAMLSLFAATLLGKFGTLSKAPPVIFVGQFLLLRTLLAGQTIRLARILWLTLAFVILFGVIVKVTFPELELAGIGEFLYYRMFDIPNEVLVEYFAAIPDSIPHGWGSGILPWLFVGPDGNHIPTYSAVAELTRGSFDSTSNAMFVGDAWAEFAWPGVIVFAFVAGALIRFIDLYAARNGFNDEWACVLAGCSYGVFTMLSTSLTTAMLTGGLALIPCLSWLLVRRRSHAAVRVPA